MGVKRVVPFPSEWHGQFVRAAARGAGLDLIVSAESGDDVILRGLSLVNNDACYSSLVAAAQAVRAVERIREERYDGEIMIELPSLCPGCRAQDAPYLVDRALAGAGFSEVRVNDALRSLLSGSDAVDDATQAHLAEGLVAGDVLLQLRCRFSPYYRLHERRYLEALIASWRKHALGLLSCKATLDARRYFSDIDRGARMLLSRPRQSNPRVGVAGSPWAVFSKGINGRLVEIIEGEECEVVLPYLSSQIAYVLRVEGISCAFLDRVEELCSYLGELSGTTPRCPSYLDLKRAGMEYVPESLLVGQGWSLAGWVCHFIDSGVDDIVYASSFGCLAGHVVGQGIMRDLRATRPNVNIASIEFDPGTSGVNQANRIKLMAAIAKRKTRGDRS